MSVDIPVLEDDFDEEPVEREEWGSYGEFQLVGNGSKTNEYCGKFLAFKGCIHVEKHNVADVYGTSYAGKVYVKVIHHWCDKPSCPVCFKSGWAVRQAGRIEARLKEASKRFGRVEHIVCSVPSKDYRLNYEVLRGKVVKVLFGCGVVGGVLIFHGFRYNLQKHWYWSPHFHVLGFILGGYARCRHCKGGNCYTCDGFEGRVYRCYRDNGYIVKALGERKTVFGTAWYQLNHSTIRAGVKRPHVAAWFGVCSYRRLKVTVEEKKDLCPICAEKLIKLCYSGVRRIVKDKGASDFLGSFVEDLVAGDGSLNWCEASSGSYL